MYDVNLNCHSEELRVEHDRPKSVPEGMVYSLAEDRLFD